jgi:hypothetical protein
MKDRIKSYYIIDAFTDAKKMIEALGYGNIGMCIDSISRRNCGEEIFFTEKMKIAHQIVMDTLENV